jgi:hypothetical protein
MKEKWEIHNERKSTHFHFVSLPLKNPTGEEERKNKMGIKNGNKAK